MVTMFTFRLLPEFVFSVFLTEVALTSAAFLSVPKDTVALVGARVELECSTNNLTLPLRWTYYASNNWQRLNSLFNGRDVSDAFASNYEVDGNPGSGRYNLIIKSANNSSAGEYLCSEDPFANSATVAFLTVIASDPLCATNVNPVVNGTIENDELWAWCAVTYIGKGIPLMKWAMDSTRNVTPSETVVNSTGAVSTFTSKIKMHVYSSANGMIISCKTIFELRDLPKRPHYYNDQTLNYTYIWNQTANVLYGPRNLNITPLFSIFDISECLFCWADGNPSPTYEWTDVETGRTVGRGSILNLKQTITTRLDKEYTFQCTAANVLSSYSISKSLNITFIVTASTENINEVETMSIFNLLVTVVGPSAMAFILILIIAFLLVSRACCKATERHQSVNGNQEVSEADTQPTIMQMEIEDNNPYSEVDVNIEESVEPSESVGAGLKARRDRIHGNTIVEPHEGQYTELKARPGHAQGNQEKELYAQLHLVNTAGTNEYADYIEIV